MVRVADVVLAALANAVRAFLGLADVVHVAGRVVGSVILERITAERTGLHALVIAVMLAIALRFAAVAADIVCRAHIRLTLHGVYARTMVRVLARGIVTAEAPVAPEQAAHTAGGMVVGAGANIVLTAAAVIRITVMLRVTLARHMLRRRIAVLADRLGIVASARAGEMAFYAAGSRIVVLTVAVAVTRHTAGRALVGQAVRNAVAISAAGSSRMLKTIAIAVTPLATDSRRMVHAVAVIVTGDIAVSQIVALLIAAVVTRQATGSIAMLFAVRNTVASHAAGRSSMAIQIITGKMAFRTAGSSGMILAIAGIVSVNLAFRTAVILAITIGMAIHPAGSCPVMVEAIAHIVTLNAASRSDPFLILRIRKHGSTQQHAQRQQQRQQLFHIPFLLIRLYPWAVYAVFIIPIPCTKVKYSRFSFHPVHMQLQDNESACYNFLRMDKRT